MLKVIHVFFSFVEVIIGFDQSVYDIIENERLVNVTIVLNGLISRDVVVILNTRDGTADCKSPINIPPRVTSTYVYFSFGQW